VGGTEEHTFLQEQQMTTVDSDNVHVLAFQGGGDDMDAPIKVAPCAELVVPSD
jgi:hypothetical protein